MRRLAPFLRAIALGAVLVAFGMGTADAAPRKRGAESGQRQHRVAEGETVYGVGRAYGVSPQAIIDANRLRAPYHLNAGQRLVVPGSASAGRRSAPVAATSATGKPKRQIERTATAPDKDAKAAPRTAGDLRPREPSASRAALRDANGPVSGKVRPGQTPQERAAAIGPIAGDVSAKGNRAAGADLAGRAGPTRKAKARKGKRVEYAEPAAQPPAHQAAASTRAPAGEPKVPPRSGSRFAWPVKGDVTQSFGRQAGGLRNDGITIRAKAGSDIRAAENGLVIFAGQGSKTSGQVVLLKHADNWITTYSPMSEIKVRRGQVVKKGEALGRVAPSTGSQPGQLQFQARHDGVPVDPIDRLSARSQVAAR